MDTKNDLIERYIYAVIRFLPQKMRQEVEQELSGLIADMLETRCGDVLPTDKDVRVVLTELGAPDELASKYSGNEHQSLISGYYMFIYKRVLKIVLPIAGAVSIFAGLLTFFQDELPSNPYLLMGKLFGQTVGSAIWGIVQAFAVITIIFAIFEWKKVSIQNGDFLSTLPYIPKTNEQIRPFEPISGIIWSVIAVVVFLGFPQIAGVWLDDAGWIPIFEVQIIRSLWLPIILGSLIGILKEIVRLVDRRYTWRLAIVTIIADIFIFLCAAMLFMNGRVMNPVFISNIYKLFVDNDAEFIPFIFANFNLVFLGILTFALALDSLTVSVKAIKA